MTLVENSEGWPGQHHDVVDVLLSQHARVRELIAEVSGATGEDRRRPFDELRTLLAVHEAAEESFVHPTTQRVGDGEAAAARVEEEHDAGRAIAHLESLDIASPEFAQAFAEFAWAVTTHAAKEELEEFPALRRDASEEVLRELAGSVVAGQQSAFAHLGAHSAAASGTGGAGVEQESFAVRLDEAEAAMGTV